MTCLAVASLADLSQAQTLLHTFEEPWFGFGGGGGDVASAGDVDGDGLDDLIVSAANPFGGFPEGAVWVYSGASGDVLWSMAGDPNFDADFGSSVAGAGDLDGDGLADVIIGVSGGKPNPPFGASTGYAIVVSPASGATIHTFAPDLATTFQSGHGANFGLSVANAGDFNNDGVPDIVVGAFAAGTNEPFLYGGAAFVYSGSTGELLVRIQATEPESSLGWSVAGAGDVDADGHADIVVGAPGHVLLIAGMTPGAAYVYSGATHEVLLAFSGVAPGDKFGDVVAGAGDVNGDGHADILVGARNTAGGDGNVSLFSGATGSLLAYFQGDPYLGATDVGLGTAVAGVGDMDADGYDDFVLGEPRADLPGAFNQGLARVYSGASLAPLFTVVGDPPGAGDPQMLGASVAGAGDINGDGIPDLLVGGGASIARAYAGPVPPSFAPYGCGTNPAGSLTLASGAATLGGTLELAVHNPIGSQPSGSLALLAVATAPDSNEPCGTSLPGIGMVGPYGPGELLISLAAPNPVLLLGPAVWGGSPVNLALEIPMDPSLLGLEIFLQGVIFEVAGPFAVTEAIKLGVGN